VAQLARSPASQPTPRPGASKPSWPSRPTPPPPPPVTRRQVGPGGHHPPQAPEPSRPRAASRAGRNRAPPLLLGPARQGPGPSLGLFSRRRRASPGFCPPPIRNNHAPPPSQP
jgi:hypothetical protein